MIDHGVLAPGLRAVMASQGGVFTAAQARSFRHGEDELQRLRTGRDPVLTSVRRGVYAWRESYESATELEQHAMRIRAVELSLSGEAVLSHVSAAVEHGLQMLDPDLSYVQITRGSDFRPYKGAGRHQLVADLREDEVLRRPGRLPATTVARTAVDLARALDRFECVVAVMDSALRLGVSKAELRAIHQRCRSWPGAVNVGRAIELADGRAANPGESWSRVVFIQEGVPPTDLQVPVYDEEGLIGYADFGWPGVLGEFDGKSKYGIDGEERAVDAVWKEKRREDRMRVGHEVVRWSVADLYRPAVLAGRVRAAQARATRRGRPSA